MCSTVVPFYGEFQKIYFRQKENDNRWKSCKNSKGQERGKYVGKFIQHLLIKTRMSNFKELKCRREIKGHNSRETKRTSRE